MDRDWILLGYRVVFPSRLDRWPWPKSPFLSVTDSLIEAFPEHDTWHTDYHDALLDWLHAPVGSRLLGVGYSRSYSSLMIDDWFAPAGVYWMPRAALPVPKSPPWAVIGYEPVALGFQELDSWRYFGGDDIQALYSERRHQINDHGLFRSHCEAVSFASVMEEFTSVEDLAWLPLMIFETDFAPIAW